MNTVSSAQSTLTYWVKKEPKPAKSKTCFTYFNTTIKKKNHDVSYDPRHIINIDAYNVIIFT